MPDAPRADPLTERRRGQFPEESFRGLRRSPFPMGASKAHFQRRAGPGRAGPGREDKGMRYRKLDRTGILVNPRRLAAERAVE